MFRTHIADKCPSLVHARLRVGDDMANVVRDAPVANVVAVPAAVVHVYSALAAAEVMVRLRGRNGRFGERSRRTSLLPRAERYGCLAVSTGKRAGRVRNERWSWCIAPALTVRCPVALGRTALGAGELSDLKSGEVTR